MNRASEVAAAEDAAPFSLGPATAQAGALLVHGFTGSPFEMRLLGEHLAARGLAVEGPLLPGHRSTTAALAATGWRDWLAGVERAFEKLQSRAPRVAVCGLSLGGLLTLELARRRASTGEIRAIAVLSTALRLPRAAYVAESVLVRLPFLMRAALPKLAGSDIADPEMKRRNTRAQGRAGMPLSSLHSLMDFGRELAPRLGEIRAPALVAHARRDHTIPFACMQPLVDGLGTPRAELRTLVLERSFHVITLDVEREMVFNAVADHLLAHLNR
ncbi:MAG TPA: alpha/beta fold hydrolase [Polyangia bacterium]|nr:alpha/beta fold hydrolase [Polyangia bacterium]